MKAKIKTCEKYKDRAGKLRYKGTPALRSTERLVSRGLVYFKIEVCALVELRHYPEPFGACIAKLREDFLRSRPNLARVIPVPLPAGVQTLRASVEDEEGLFGFGQLKAAYEYLRAAKGLKLPQHWKDSGEFHYVLPERVPFVLRRSTSFD